MESFERMGYWWLPGEPNKRINKIPDTAIPGKLSFDPVTGGMLELLGNLDDSDLYGINVEKNFEIIQGIVSESERCVTLQGCFVISITPHLSTFSKTKLIVDYIFTGSRYWFDSSKDIVFENLSVDFTYLNDWMLQKNIDTDMSYSHQEGLNSFSAKYTKPDPIEIPLDIEKITIWAKFGCNTSMTEVSIKDEYRISIAPKEPVHFFEYREYIDFHLPNFLTLATGHTNFPLNVSGLVSEDRVSIHYKIVGFTEKVPRLTPLSMLFTYDDVKEVLPKYLTNWIRKSEKLRAIYSLYFREHYSKLIVLDSEFLSLAQALEAYHRNVYGGEYLSEQEYEPIMIKLINAIPDCLDDSHHDSLRGRLKYGNQYSLRTRLNRIYTDILSEQKDDLCKMLGKPKEFIHRIVETRNYLTHRDGEPSCFLIDNNQLYEYCRKMRVLLQICFLHEMEFSPIEISRLLDENQEYQSLTKVNSA